jgi:hypothetical protein
LGFFFCTKLFLYWIVDFCFVSQRGTGIRTRSTVPNLFAVALVR